MNCLVKKSQTSKETMDWEELTQRTGVQTLNCHTRGLNRSMPASFLNWPEIPSKQPHPSYSSPHSSWPDGSYRPVWSPQTLRQQPNLLCWSRHRRCGWFRCWHWNYVRQLNHCLCQETHLSTSSSSPRPSCALPCLRPWGASVWWSNSLGPLSTIRSDYHTHLGRYGLNKLWEQNKNNQKGIMLPLFKST